MPQGRLRLPLLTRGTAYVVSAIACLAIGLAWRPILGRLFTARGPLPPTLDLLGQLMFWAYPVRYLLFIASAFLLFKALKDS